MNQIKKATIKDAKLLSKISTNSFLPAHGHSASKKDIDNYIAKKFNEQELSKELSNLENEYYFIYHKGEIVGYSKVIFYSPNKNIEVQNITQMSRLYLLEAFYGLDLGKELFNFNIKLSKQNNQKGIWLAVWMENKRAIKFYKKMGFEIVGSFDFKISETHSNPNHILYLAYS